MTSAFRGYKVREFQETPNPAAIKCLLDRPVDPLAGEHALRSYRSADAAAADPLASRLFAVPGVANVLIGDAWVTVSKSDAGAWKTLKPAITKALAG